MNFDFLHPKEQVAEILKRIIDLDDHNFWGGMYRCEMKKENIWITPGAVDKGKVSSSDMFT